MRTSARVDKTNTHRHDVKHIIPTSTGTHLSEKEHMMHARRRTKPANHAHIPSNSFSASNENSCYCGCQDHPVSVRMVFVSSGRVTFLRQVFAQLFGQLALGSRLQRKNSWRNGVGIQDGLGHSHRIIFRLSHCSP